MEDSPLLEKMRKILRGEVRANESLARHSSFRIGGPAQFLVLPADDQDVARLQALVRAEGLPLYIIGLGTNILFPDEGLPGIVLKLAGRLNQITASGRLLHVGAGAPLVAVAREAARRGLTGLEFAEGIPGTLGGAVYMNAGAFGGEMARVVKEVQVRTEMGEARILSGAEMDFRYRFSRLQRDKGWAVTAVVLELAEDDPTRILSRMDTYRAKRQATQPKGYPNVGSIFKNPPGEAAGRLIERVGAKGWRVGGAEVSTTHANFIVNRGGATARDVLTLMDRIQRAVEEATGIRLEPEVQVLAAPPG